MHGCKQAWMNHICQVYEIKEDVRCMRLQHFISCAHLENWALFSEKQLNENHYVHYLCYKSHF